MDTVDVLRGAKEVLVDPQCWIKGTPVLDVDDQVTEHYSRGVKFCLLGALYRVSRGSDYMGGVMALVQTLTNPNFHGDETIVGLTAETIVATFNDKTAASHDEIIDLLDRTILRLQSAVTEEKEVAVV